MKIHFTLYQNLIRINQRKGGNEIVQTKKTFLAFKFITYDIEISKWGSIGFIIFLNTFFKYVSTPFAV